ncbi:MAG: nitrilase-related carbon-nitrogen hydrolase [Candidatus Binatus sp.]
MADRANDGSARLGNLARSPVRSVGPRYSGDRLNNPSGGLALAAIAAVATALLYEVASLEPALWPCALLAPLPLLAAAPEIRTASVAQLAFMAYLIGNLGSWGGESFAVPLVNTFVSHLAGAAVFAAFVACATEATRRWSGLLAALVFPTFETAFYFTLGQQSPHGTWGSPAYSQVDFVPLLQTASWLGMCGVMFIMSLLPAGLAVAWYRRRWNMDWKEPAILAVGVFALAVIGGWIRMIRTPSTGSVRVAMVASDSLIPQAESNDVSDAADIVTLYAKLVSRVAGQGVQIVVLPEKVVGVAPSYEWDVVKGFQRIASMAHVYLVVGINQLDRTPKKNIAVVFGPDGNIVAKYAKHHPIPDLEGDYKAGRKQAIFDAPWGRTAVLISQDLDFPDIARDLAANGVLVVMAPAADWAGSELIHEQMAVVRGVESGFSIARSARGGMISATDDRGRQLVVQAPLSDKNAVAVADLPMGTGPTLYSRTDDWFGRLCVIFTILLMIRLTISIWYAARMRRMSAANRISHPGVVSVDVMSAGQEEQNKVDEDEQRIYRPPTRPPQSS